MSGFFFFLAKSFALSLFFLLRYFLNTLQIEAHFDPNVIIENETLRKLASSPYLASQGQCDFLVLESWNGSSSLWLIVQAAVLGWQLSQTFQAMRSGLPLRLAPGF